jgi:hypothetical protein
MQRFRWLKRDNAFHQSQMGISENSCAGGWNIRRDCNEFQAMTIFASIPTNSSFRILIFKNKTGTLLFRAMVPPVCVQFATSNSLTIVNSSSLKVFSHAFPPPVALLVKRGVCSDEEKAIAASKYIYPPGIVEFVIVDGDLSLYQEEANDTTNQTEIISLGQLQLDSQRVLYKNRTATMEKPSSYAAPWESEINVAILHVSSSVGYELAHILTLETRYTYLHGGTRILLNSQGPSDKKQKLFVCFSLGCFIAACGCCCFTTGSIQAWMQEEEQRDAQRPQRRRTTRRRLTPGQVGMKFPIYVFDGTGTVHLVPNRSESCPQMTGQPNETDVLAVPTGPAEGGREQNAPPSRLEPNSLDSCSICLDDFAPGDKLHCLPCSHAFHSRCIAKWLSERSATCPLCKFDVYEEEEEEETDEPTVENVPAVSVEVSVAGVSEDVQERWWTRGLEIGRWGRGLLLQREARPSVTTDLTTPLLSEEQRSEATEGVAGAAAATLASSTNVPSRTRAEQSLNQTQEATPTQADSPAPDEGHARREEIV